MRFSHFGAIVKYTDTRASIVSVSALELSSGSILPPDGAARILGHDNLLPAHVANVRSGSILLIGKSQERWT
jgi:hypothetical protein